MINELGIDNSLGNPTYTLTTLTKEEILDNHRSVLCSFGILTKDDELDLPSLYWIPKLHKWPYKQRYIAGQPHWLISLAKVYVIHPHSFNIKAVGRSCSRVVGKVTIFFNFYLHLPWWQYIALVALKPWWSFIYALVAIDLGGHLYMPWWQ